MPRNAAFWLRASYRMLSSSGLLAFGGCQLISPTEKTHAKSSRIVRCFGRCASCTRRGYRSRRAKSLMQGGKSQEDFERPDIFATLYQCITQ